ncbi:MAG: SDR family NAD(P)-dependent oxidoreductase [Ilumatobacteraceae bacterium]
MVTGGTRGIGFGIAAAFVAEGATVVVNGRSEAKGAQALEALGGGDAVAFVQADVSSRPDVDRLIDETVERFGRIDVLVNNAGGSSQLGPITSLTDEGWQGTIDWILNSAFWGTRKALQQMVPQRSGRIINISSTEGKRGFAMASPYSAAKHGLHGLTKSAALEVGVDGITVNAICPGLVATDMTEEAGREAAVSMGITYEQFLDGYAQETAIKRLVTVEEIAALAVLLASDAGGGITGACISIDGGSTPY